MLRCFSIVHSKVYSSVVTLFKCVQQALRAEDLEGDAEGEYGMTSGRAFIGNSTRSASAMGRTARPLGAAGAGATSSRPPLDALSISSGAQSPVPQGLPTPTSATMKRSKLQGPCMHCTWHVRLLMFLYAIFTSCFHEACSLLHGATSAVGN